MPRSEPVAADEPVVWADEVTISFPSVSGRVDAVTILRTIPSGFWLG